MRLLRASPLSTGRIMSHQDFGAIVAYPLNAMQQQCVFHGEGPLLVLAGAGSGKTGVIVNRITHLVREKVRASEICAVTFTNKAAREMRERVRSLVGTTEKNVPQDKIAKGKQLSIKGIFIGTFHSLGLMVLRENIEAASLRENFLIMGSDDQLTLAHEILVHSGVDIERFDEKKLIHAISEWKNSGENKNDYFANDIWRLKIPERPVLEIIDEYSTRLMQTNTLDFDDLILRPTRLLETNAAIREKYRTRFSYFLVDEFQDTNPLQFRFLTELMRSPFNLTAVGDDDQSIYSWRGADTRIMLEFKTRFPEAKIVALEQNYRSDQFILDIANRLIQNNTDRHKKNLFSERKTPNNAVLFQAADGLGEAEYVADKIASLKIQHRLEYSAFCVLYRTNFQSRSFEEVLRQRNIPYHVSGSFQFYDRSEIKDILAYLRFFANHADDRSLMRVLLMPKRGVSETTIERLTQYAHLNKKHLWEVLNEIEMCEIEISATALSGILAFRDFVSEHETEIRKVGQLAKSAQKLIDSLELEKEYVRQGIEAQKIVNKLLNIRELVRSIEDFEFGKRQIPGIAEDSERSLYTYLQFVALLTQDDKEENAATPRVELMTIHQAKGLEFDTVFIAGLEEGVLPHQRSVDAAEENDNHAIEEERRLLYVALTRAKRRLYLTYSISRKNRGLTLDTTPSRFLDELPQHLIEWENTDAQEFDASNLEALFSAI
ncbi:MAG: ATP-dependent DNA helicase PcrA [Turneriella sp.]|nr:ATP-dependent DNA helicase PcrA [Turneriella sp.]